MTTQDTALEGDESVRSRLLDAASRHFAQKGYAATTVREIVEAAGVTKPVLYYYFGNKEGIYLQIMEKALGTVHDLIAETMRSAGSARERIELLLDRTFTVMLEHLDVVRVMDSIYYGPPQGAPFFDFEIFHQEFEGALQTLVERGIALGELRPADPEVVTLAILGALDVAKGIHLCHPERSRGRQGLHELLDVVFHGVLNPAHCAKETTS
jgi:TetR/AcrR family transcriptional regulator